MALLRFGFFFLFVSCNTKPGYFKDVFPNFFKHDFVYALIMFGFSLSNGYISSMAFANAPAYLSYFLFYFFSIVTPEENEFSSQLLTLLLGIGLAFGSFSSFIFLLFN